MSTVTARSKYEGVKLHLDAAECQELLEGWESTAHEMASTVVQFLKKHPEALKKRSSKQIKQTLKAELEKSTKQLKALKRGKDWTALSR